MKATLYQFATSPFCSKVRKILDYKGLDYQVIEVDYVERKELIAASGQIMSGAEARGDWRVAKQRRSWTRTVSRCGLKSCLPSPRFCRRAAAVCISRSRVTSTAK